MTKLDTLTLDFIANGGEFHNDANFAKAVEFLAHISAITKESYKTALGGLYDKKTDTYGVEPDIRINRLAISSVSGTIYTVIPPTLGLLAPHINFQTWECLKNSFELIQILTSLFFSDSEKVPAIVTNEKVENSPIIVARDGSTVIVNNINIVNNAKRIYTPVGQISESVKTGTISDFKITPKRIDTEPIIINKENSLFFDARGLHICGASPDSFFCKIYRVNIKQRNGLITIFESPDQKEYGKNTNFTISSADLNSIVDALKHEYSTATGIINFKTTLFGEREIESVTLHSIENTGPRQI